MLPRVMRAFFQYPLRLTTLAKYLPSTTTKPFPNRSLPGVVTRDMSALWSADLGPIINLGKGHPNPRLLPLKAVEAAFHDAAAKPNAAVTMLQYGRMQGNEHLCQRIAQWIDTTCNKRPNLPKAENVLITTGSGPAMSLVVQLFTKPGDVIIADSPGYFLAYHTFEDCRLEVKPVATDSNGLDVDQLEALLKEGLRPSMVYTVPIANNPTGVGMSDERKEKLVRLAREYKFKIAADEVYMFLKFGSEDPPKSLFEYDDPSEPVVLSVNSFSKLLGPGLRLGWLAAHEPYMSRLLDHGTLQSGGGFNPMTSAVVLELFDRGFVDEHVQVLREEYQRSSEALCAALEEHLQPALRSDEKLKYEKPEGGFFCFITLPSRFDADKLLLMAKKNGVSFFVGKHFSPGKSEFKSSLRVCFAWCEISDIVEGVRRLAKTVRDYEP